MKTVVFYISDVGWGHATRQIPLITHFCRIGYQVVVRNNSAFELLNIEFSHCEGVKVERTRYPNDPGWPSVYPFKKQELKKTIACWCSLWDLWVDEEKRFLEKLKPALVISDIVAPAFEVCHMLDIPCVAVTSLNWWDEYSYILGDFPCKDRFEKAYSLASWCFLLPLESENRVFKLKERTPLLVRDFDTDKVRGMRRKLISAYRPQLIALATLGGFYRSEGVLSRFRRAMLGLSKIADILWVCPSYLHTQGLKCFEYKGMDFHNMVAISDFVFSKFGYGIASECIKARVPAVFLYRSEVLEDSVVTEDLALSSWILRFPMDSEFEIPLEDIFSLEPSKLSKRMYEDGALFIIQKIKERFL